MASKISRSPEDWIQFLITVVEYAPTKPDWNAIAIDTGTYKSGKFVNQAYTNLRKKYGTLPGTKGGAAATIPVTPKRPRTAKTPKTPKSGKASRKHSDIVDEDDPDGTPKRMRKTKKEEIKEDDEQDDDVKDEDGYKIDRRIIKPLEVSSDGE